MLMAISRKQKTFKLPYSPWRALLTSLRHEIERASHVRWKIVRSQDVQSIDLFGPDMVLISLIFLISANPRLFGADSGFCSDQNPRTTPANRGVRKKYIIKKLKWQRRCDRVVYYDRVDGEKKETIRWFCRFVSNLNSMIVLPDQRERSEPK